MDILYLLRITVICSAFNQKKPFTFDLSETYSTLTALTDLDLITYITCKTAYIFCADFHGLSLHDKYNTNTYTLLPRSPRNNVQLQYFISEYCAIRFFVDDSSLFH